MLCGAGIFWKVVRRLSLSPGTSSNTNRSQVAEAQHAVVAAGRAIGEIVWFHGNQHTVKGVVYTNGMLRTGNTDVLTGQEKHNLVDECGANDPIQRDHRGRGFIYFIPVGA